MPYYVCYKCVFLSVDLLYIYFFYLFKIPNYKGVKIMLIYGLLYAIFCFSDKFQSYDDLCSTTAKNRKEFLFAHKGFGFVLECLYPYSVVICRWVLCNADPKICIS